MLFHGSRLSNWAGILGQGLRIAPPEAPPTGYMFGKGVYFADMASKSANYCWATPSRYKRGFEYLTENFKFYYQIVYCCLTRFSLLITTRKIQI